MWTDVDQARLSSIVGMGGGVGELGGEAGSEGGAEGKEPGREQMSEKLCGEPVLAFCDK